MVQKEVRVIKSRFSGGKKFYKDQFIEILQLFNRLGIEGRQVTSILVEDLIPLKLTFEHEKIEVIEGEEDD